MEEKYIINALTFSSLINNAHRDSFRELLKLVIDFSKIYDVEKADLSYHINLIDELHADENAHSRIFAKLLRYTENNKYPFLESFLKAVCEFNIDIEEPIIEKVDSCGRIDIPILDKKYFVIIENKITDKAPDQNISEGGQLARYIESVRNNYSKVDEEIYVVYTPKYTREPSDECWINKYNFSYKDDFKNRFISLSYRDAIYPWLKNKILPYIIKKENKYLVSAVVQYIDHLEGMFSLRKINRKMNIKLQKFIKQELGLQDDKPELATEILNDKEEELENAINQIKLLKSKYQRQIIENQFEEWKLLLESDFPELDIVCRKYDDEYIIIGVNLLIKKKKITALIECELSEEYAMCCGFGIHEADDKLKNIPAILKRIIEQYKLEDSNDYWYGAKDTSIENSYMVLKTLIKEFISE